MQIEKIQFCVKYVIPYYIGPIPGYMQYTEDYNI